ncbi:MAG: ribonuclease E/G, partial [Phycisphaerales bacterium]
MDNGHTNETTDDLAGELHRERLEGGQPARGDANHDARTDAGHIEDRAAAQSHDPDYGFVDGSDLESGPLSAGDGAEDSSGDEPNEREGRFTDARSEIGLEDEEQGDGGAESDVEPTPEELEQLAEERADAEEAAAAYARASMMAFEAPAPERDAEEDDELEVHRGEKPKQLVVVNDVPGEETRIAILEQGKLAQFFSERAATATNVGSIYKARVVNVEPAIQAAFVDFGQGANGFLHISDLHPKYFPGDKDRTEKVGRKIPRRSRPLIQDALKRGMEITVQVLKEGLGSKGPTVTSYLSIPGRLLVMMPDMDNVGVSRKVDDEDGRRKMRKILDSLNLPEGFGFILRTAGFDSTRTELARDAQYLTRLWQVMEKRMNAVGAPCELYTEGDILLRTIRDSIDASVDGIVVDSESAFHRAKAFLEVVSPRTATKVHYWDRKTPVFHAFDIERQVDL